MVNYKYLLRTQPPAFGLKNVKPLSARGQKVIYACNTLLNVTENKKERRRLKAVLLSSTYYTITT